MGDLKKAVFLDRDGTVMDEVGYCSRTEDVRAVPGAREALLALRDAGYLLIVVTNQSGIGHGYFSEDEYLAVNAELERQLAPVQFDAVYFSPETPDAATERRKPGIGMVTEAAERFRIDLARSFSSAIAPAMLNAGGGQERALSLSPPAMEPTIANHVPIMWPATSSRPRELF